LTNPYEEMAAGLRAVAISLRHNDHLPPITTRTIDSELLLRAANELEATGAAVEAATHLAFTAANDVVTTKKQNSELQEANGRLVDANRRLKKHVSWWKALTRQLHNHSLELERRWQDGDDIR
jgi:hypothetical protein